MIFRTETETELKWFLVKKTETEAEKKRETEMIKKIKIKMINFYFTSVLHKILV